MKPLATGGLNRAPKERTRKRPAGQAEQFASAASAFQSRLGRERERGSSKKLHSAGCGVFLSPFFCCVFLSFPRAPAPTSDAPPPPRPSDGAELISRLSSLSLNLLCSYLTRSCSRLSVVFTSPFSLRSLPLSFFPSAPPPASSLSSRPAPRQSPARPPAADSSAPRAPEVLHVMKRKESGR